MNSAAQSAVLTFVIDVEAENATVNSAGLLHLASLFDRSRIPATWGVSAQSHSRPLEILLGRLPAADLAIVLPQAGSGPADRSTLAQELDRRCSLLQAIGKHPSGVCLTKGRAPERLDLFVKHKIRWIIEPEHRTSKGTPSSTGDLVERSPRFGVWTAGPSWLIPDGSSWGRTWMRLAARRKLLSVVQHGRPAVARVSLAGLVATPSAWNTLEETLRTAAKWRNRGKMQFESLAGLSLLLRPPKNAQMRSILRDAA